MDRETWWCVDALFPLTSPSLTIYSPYHHTYSMCISTVHYCCHRNVMHSVSYRLTQLIEIPCLICSGSFILILFWKGIVNTVWRRAERRGGKDEWTREKKEAGSSSLLFSPPLFSPSLSSLPPSLFSLMSVLSIGSQCESMVVIYTHTVALYYAHVAISSLILWPSVCLCRWLVQGEAGGAFRRRWHCWYSLCGDKEKFYLRWYRHWLHSGSGGFINHRMDCIAFIPTDHISSHMIVFIYNTDQFTYHIYPCLFDTHYTHKCYFLFCMPSNSITSIKK